jgi:hypothetical protein
MMFSPRITLSSPQATRLRRLRMRIDGNDRQPIRSHGSVDLRPRACYRALEPVS